MNKPAVWHADSSAGLTSNTSLFCLRVHNPLNVTNYDTLRNITQEVVFCGKSVKWGHLVSFYGVSWFRCFRLPGCCQAGRACRFPKPPPSGVRGMQSTQARWIIRCEIIRNVGEDSPLSPFGSVLFSHLFPVCTCVCVCSVAVRGAGCPWERLCCRILSCLSWTSPQSESTLCSGLSMSHTCIRAYTHPSKNMFIHHLFYFSVIIVGDCPSICRVQTGNTSHSTQHTHLQ